MKTKTLLIAAAALAVGVISSEAQVYSQNIVGYVNVPVIAGFNLIDNPLLATTNDLASILPPRDTSQVLIWNGVNAFATYTYDTTAWVDDSSNPANPQIKPGVGFFYFSPVATNLTFTGQTYANPGSSATNTVLSGFRLIGSQVPYGGAVTNSTFNLPSQDTAQVLKWNGVNAYNTWTFDTTLWLDDSSNPSVPTVNVGQGFFYFSPAASTNWVQSL